VARHQGSITGAILMDPAKIAERLGAPEPHREIVVCSISSNRAIPSASPGSAISASTTSTAAMRRGEIADAPYMHH
jgi:hypothetical protein